LSTRAIISDFGGVLTTPLIQSFVAFQDQTGIAMETLGLAMQRMAERDGSHPLFDLEKGELTEALVLERIADELEPELGLRP
jgi:putative hydrolase of the HAD superfamily